MNKASNDEAARWDDLAEAVTQGEGGRIRASAGRQVADVLAAVPAVVMAELAEYAAGGAR